MLGIAWLFVLFSRRFPGFPVEFLVCVFVLLFSFSRFPLFFHGFSVGLISVVSFALFLIGFRKVFQLILKFIGFAIVFFLVFP